MNEQILAADIQAYISKNINADVSKIALAKSPFAGVTAAELANQISAKKKAEKKLPTWFNTTGIYFPSALSVEQTSSEETAKYKPQLVKGNTLIDITAGFGVDSFYYAKHTNAVISCEINTSLSAISNHNAKLLGAENIKCLATDGLEYLLNTEEQFGTVYLDPARRNTSGKVFKLADCTPNVIDHLDLLFSKTERIVIKTSPLLDLQAGLLELTNVAEIHVISVKNECKELLWVLDRGYTAEPKIIAATLNNGNTKSLSFDLAALKQKTTLAQMPLQGFLYEPDVALMKTGAFDFIANHYGLNKLANQSHLYHSDSFKSEFIGRIFKIDELFKPNELKKRKLKGNVIVRNFPEKPENLVKKYKIEPSKNEFLIFTQTPDSLLVIAATIEQYY